MPLSATSEVLASFRVSDLTATAPCGPSLFERTGFCKQAGPVLVDTRDGYREAREWQQPKAISEIARLRRSLPEPDPENRAAINIRSASTTDNHGYRWLGRPDFPTLKIVVGPALAPRAPDKEVPDRCGRVPPVGTKTCQNLPSPAR
jgi:hypothetical protein